MNGYCCSKPMCSTSQPSQLFLITATRFLNVRSLSQTVSFFTSEMTRTLQTCICSKQHKYIKSEGNRSGPWHVIKLIRKSVFTQRCGVVFVWRSCNVCLICPSQVPRRFPQLSRFLLRPEGCVLLFQHPTVSSANCCSVLSCNPLCLQVNTFQAVIGYDETDSYVLFLYPNGGLNFFGTRPKVSWLDERGHYCHSLLVFQHVRVFVFF